MTMLTEKLKDHFNFEDFLFTNYFFEFEGSYTNDDYQMWLKIINDEILIWDYEDGSENPRQVIVPIPKTLDEAINSLLKAMWWNDEEIPNEAIEEIKADYYEYQHYRLKTENPFIYMIYKNQLPK
jgi:hypothetical protein